VTHSTTTKPTIIGMHGFPRSGKDASAFHLTTGRGFTRFSFGDNLRDELIFLDPFVNGKDRLADAIEAPESKRLIARFAELITATGGDVALAELAARTLNPFIDGDLRHNVMLENHDYDWDAVKADPSLNGEPRRLQRLHGTEVRRELFTQSYWSDLVKSQIDESGSAFVVISDTRFPNEADFVHELGGTVIEVVRPGISTNVEHLSDVRLPSSSIDVTIVNDGTLRDLADKVDAELFDRSIAFFSPTHHQPESHAA
jgi:hypothetical protein